MQQYSLSVQTQRLGGLVIRIICTRNGPNLLLNSNKCRNHPPAFFCQESIAAAGKIQNISFMDKY